MIDYAEDVSEIKRLAGRIKTLLDKADMEQRYAAQAVGNAAGQLSQMRQQLAHLETTLTQYVGQRAKAGPSETKAALQSTESE